MDEITFNIDGLEIKARKGDTILQAAAKNGIYIPNLCYNSYLKPVGACRLCLVENEDGRLITSCETQVVEGMKISSTTPRVESTRKMVAQLLIANHEVDCLTCAQNNQCQLQEISSFFGIERDDIGNFRRIILDIELDESNPFFKRDLKKCVLCGICVRTCRDRLGVSAIDFGGRGYETKITTFLDQPILNSNCVSCGECVVACPVGALVPKDNSKPSREVKTTCTYCGVGCGLYLGVRGNQISSVRGDPEHPLSQGNLCVKGRYGFNFVNNPERLKKPLIKKNGKFVKVEWDEALEFAAQKLSKYKGDSFAAISSARCTNEDNYTLQKFTRVGMGTNNVDNSARSCHAPSVAALAESLGSGAMSNSIVEITNSKCLFLIGTNPVQSYPVLSMRIMDAVKNGATLIVADPRNTEIASHADLFIQHNPGTDVALIMGIIRVIVDEKLIDLEFIQNRCEDYDLLLESLQKFDLETVEDITGVSSDDIMKAAQLYATADPAAIFYSLGITEHSHGTDNVFALSNLALITGNIGKPFSGVNPIRGQNNVQGSCDMGCLPDVYPGYQKVENPEANDKFQNAWNSELSPTRGLKMPEMMEAARNGEVKAMYIMGENPALSEPDCSNIQKALESLDFLMVQDLFLTQTALHADLVLPGASFAEKDGTFANADRRVQRVRKAVEPAGDSKPDWQIISELAQKMGVKGFEFQDAQEVAVEIASLAPIYGGMLYQCLEEESRQWPCYNEEHPGTPILHQEEFSTKTGKARFIPLSYRPPAEIPDEEYPMVLTTGRRIFHYHTSTMTGATKGLKELYDQDPVEISPQDAEKLDLTDGEMVWVISRRGKIKAPIEITERSPEGLIFMAFHSSDTKTNLITSPACDPATKTPEFKYCAVKIEKCVE
ncbi:MAG TPA: formate dehydrogenase subunit alpha [Methanobacteriaceae archaeon]|nr:formate dehydrogenase subunit alpha [Methanobacteriaceae archaeon]